MDNLQAKKMLKQVDCHGIPRGYNGGYSELYDYCLKSIDKLEKIEQIINRPSTSFSAEDKAYNYMMQVVDIKEVLENG